MSRSERLQHAAVPARLQEQQEQQPASHSYDQDQISTVAAAVQATNGANATSPAAGEHQHIAGVANGRAMATLASAQRDSTVANSGRRQSAATSRVPSIGVMSHSDLTTPVNMAELRSGRRPTAGSMANGMYTSAMEEELTKMPLDRKYMSGNPFRDACDALKADDVSELDLNLEQTDLRLDATHKLDGIGDADLQEGTTLVHAAAQFNAEKCMELLLKRCSAVRAYAATADRPNKDGYTPFAIAAKYGSVQVAKRLARTKERLLCRNGEGMNALHIACRYGRTEMVEWLLTLRTQSGPRGEPCFPINEPDSGVGGGYPPLLWCVDAVVDAQEIQFEGHHTMYALLRAGANPNFKHAGEGDTALMWAANRTQMKAVALLCRFGADLETKNKKGESAFSQDTTGGLIVREALWRAVEYGDEKAVKKYCQMIKETQSWTLPTYSILPDALSQVGNPDNGNPNPATYSSRVVIEDFGEHLVDVRRDGWRYLEDQRRHSPLAVCAVNNSPLYHRILSHLLQLWKAAPQRCGLNPWQYDKGHTQLPHHAKASICTHVTPNGLTIPSTINRVGHSNCTFNHSPADCSLVHHVLHGLLPVHMAARAGNTEAISTFDQYAGARTIDLVEHAGEQQVNVKRTYAITEPLDRCAGWSAIHYAAHAPTEDLAVETVQHLTRHRARDGLLYANPTESDHNGNTVLHYAAAFGRARLVQAALHAIRAYYTQEAGPSASSPARRLSAGSSSNASASAAEDGIERLVTLFINRRNMLGNTALHYAVASTLQLDVVSDAQLRTILVLLKQSGVSPHHPVNAHNLTPAGLLTVINVQPEDPSKPTPTIQASSQTHRQTLEKLFAKYAQSASSGIGEAHERFLPPTHTSISTIVSLGDEQSYAVSTDSKMVVVTDFAHNRERCPLPVYNTIDNQRADFASPKFRYLSSHIYANSPSGKHVAVPYPTLAATKHDCCSIDTCSPEHNDCRSADNCYCARKTQPTQRVEHRIVAGSDYSCTANCTCYERCGNRLEAGLHVKVKIVKDCCRGYVVVADQTIAAGSYVCEYVGEVIPSGVAEERVKLYSRVGILTAEELHQQYRVLEDYPLTLEDVRSLLRPRFVVQLTDMQHRPISFIDGFRLGNASRFLQQACTANLRVQMLYHLPDAPTPRVLFFADRSIEVGEELTLPHDPYDCAAHSLAATASARYRVFVQRQHHQHIPPDSQLVGQANGEELILAGKVQGADEEMKDG